MMTGGTVPVTTMATLTVIVIMTDCPAMMMGGTVPVATMAALTVVVVMT